MSAPVGAKGHEYVRLECLKVAGRIAEVGIGPDAKRTPASGTSTSGWVISMAEDFYRFVMTQ